VPYPITAYLEFLMHHSKFCTEIRLFFFATVIPWCGPISLVSAADSPPNVVFIFVDDQGYYDLGCYGATEIKTPRIDAMAEQGTRFTDYYAAAPICSPSRAGLLTGCYPRRVGNHVWVHRADSKTGIHPDELTIAELFKDNGYATACIGKWHLGFHEPFLPRNQGFDHYFGLLHNLDPVEIVYFEDKGGVPLMRNEEVVKRPADPAELTRLYTDEAIGFIEQNKEHPFFLYLPHTMLHNPLGVSDKFKGTSQWGEYGDAIHELDHNVGRLFDSLQRLHIDDNTIVIYASDNGRGPGRTPDQKIRGNKLSTFEGGIRVPAIAWGPGLGLQSGEKSSEVVHAMDWYPTLATFAGIKVPEGRVIDGRDISPLLKGETKFVPAAGMQYSLNATIPLRRRWDPPGEWEPIITRAEYNDAFFYHGSQGALSAVRWRNWKLYLNPSLQLYDLAEDPGESKLVRNQEITRKLRGMAIMFQAEMQLDARPAGRVSAPRAD
jgi:arylsulfatase A-like enzyme